MATRPSVYTQFTNIRVLPSGYQVTLTRGGNEFSRHFAGHSENSLQAALRFRDKALRELPSKRINAIPRQVLAAVGRTEAVVGVSRTPSRSIYQVSFREKDKWKGRAFGWGRMRTEADAYAAAVAFREQVVRQASSSRKSKRA